MSIFTLPDDALPELKLPRGYCLDWTRITPSGSAVECNLYFPEDDAGYCLGMANADGNVVCNRLSGGTLDEATFAEPISEENLNNIEQKFLKLLAEEEPDHPWVCKLRTPREGTHPRSMENVLR